MAHVQSLMVGPDAQHASYGSQDLQAVQEVTARVEKAWPSLETEEIERDREAYRESVGAWQHPRTARAKRSFQTENRTDFPACCHRARQLAM
jgi:hypothetical protein